MFDEIEICYHHINLIQCKMNELYSCICNDSEICEIFQENSIINNIQKIQNAIQNDTPISKVNIPAKIVENDKIQLANKTIIYFLKYLQLTKKQILKYKEIILSSVFKSNQLLTIRFCHLFVIFSKIVFFLSKFPICSQIVLALNAASSNKESKNQDIELLQIALECTLNRDKFLSICLLPVKFFIQKIISEIANIIIKLNDNCTFEQFSIFYCEPPKVTTLPSLEYIVLLNYPVIHDMLKIVFNIFEDLMISNHELAKTVFSESKSIYLSSNILFQFDDKLFISIFLQQELPNESSEESQIKQYKQLLNQISINSQKSHVQKIQYVLFLLKDYFNFAQFSFDYVMDNYIKLIALTNFAIYEITTLLATREQLKEFDYNLENIKDSEFNYILELLTVIIDLVDFMKTKQDDIKRYYLFNLGTNDLQFLTEGMKEFQMISEPSNDLLPIIDLEQYNLNEKSQFLSVIYNELFRMVESLKIIDLEKYDSGENYCFLPININIGRLIWYYSKNIQSTSGEFLNIVFEHLNTILLHISFVENTYSSYCNFSNLYTYIEDIFLNKLSKGDDISINNFAPLLKVLEYLQNDLAISKDSQYIAESSGKLISISISKLQSYFLYILSNTSPYMDSSLYSSTPILTTSFSLNMPKTSDNEIRIYDKNLSDDKKEKQTVFIKNEFEYYDFYNRIMKVPNLLSIFSKQIVKELPIFAYHSRSGKNQVSASDIKKANITLVEYFWPFFTILNLPFKRIMYNSRLNQSMIPNNSNFLRQFNLYDGNAGQIKSVDQRLFIHYSNYLEEFLDKKMYQTVLYQAANNGFFPGQYLSASAFRNIIDDFGPYFVLNIDVILTNHIANSIIKIYQNFFDNSTIIVSLYQRFKETSELPNNYDVEDKILPICDEFIKLGATVVIRRLLRSQSALSCEENLTGFMKVISHRIKSSLDVLAAGPEGMARLSHGEKMIAEVLGGNGGGSRNLFLAIDDEFAFVRSIIKRKNFEQYTDFSAFCFYMSLMLLNDRFNNIRYYQNIDAIDGNVHLFPVAIGAIIDCGGLFFDCFDGNSVKFGLEKFFLVFSAIYKMRSENVFSTEAGQNVPVSETLNSLIYLATLFPKYIRSLEYERIEEVFPLIEMTQILIENKNEQNA